MYKTEPVAIPDLPGRITFRKKGDNVYVEYLVNRIYDPKTQQSRTIRRDIGVQIPGRDDMMLPNENYEYYLQRDDGTAVIKITDEIKLAAEEIERLCMLRDFFDQLYYEFQMMGRKDRKEVVNRNKVERLNRVLEPLLEMMAGEEYAQFLEVLPMPEVETKEDGTEVIRGMSYGDVALLMSQYKGALNRFCHARI